MSTTKKVVGTLHSVHYCESGGPAVEHTKIDEDGTTHTYLIGRTACGEGNLPTEGHKPMRVVETAFSASSPRDESGDSTHS